MCLELTPVRNARVQRSNSASEQRLQGRGPPVAEARQSGVLAGEGGREGGREGGKEMVGDITMSVPVTVLTELLLKMMVKTLFMKSCRGGHRSCDFYTDHMTHRGAANRSRCESNGRHEHLRRE